MLHYPWRVYGSGLLRDHMEYEEVNNPQRPEYLPAPVLERGYAVDMRPWWWSSWAWKADGDSEKYGVRSAFL